MRNAFVLAVPLMLAACSDSGDELDTTPAFEITSSPITLAPGEESTKCYYFTTPNTETVAIYKWVSEMTPGSHHMIMFKTLGGEQPPDGTIDENCGAHAVQVYGTQIAREEVVFPSDDGNGKRLAQNVEPQAGGYFQMHYFNSTDQPLTANVSIKAYALRPDQDYTRTDIFATYNNDIRIPAGATNHVVKATCGVVDGKFFSLSTHAHKQAIATRIAEGTETVFSSNDWEHPGNARFNGPQYYQFGSGELTWECTYNNTGDNAGRTITAGQSAKTNEMCMATGYYFPATGPKGCLMIDGECMCLL